MLKKLNWGMAVLIVFMIAAGGFMYWQMSEVQRLKQQLAQDDKLLEQNDKVQHADNREKSPPPNETSETGHWHGDKWHRTAPPSTDNPPEPMPVHIDTPIDTAQTDFESLIPKREDYNTDWEYVEALLTRSEQYNAQASILVKSDPDAALKLLSIGAKLTKEYRTLHKAAWDKVLEKYPIGKQPNSIDTGYIPKPETELEPETEFE